MQLGLPLTRESLEKVFAMTTRKYSDETKSLIFRVLSLTKDADALIAIKFMAKVGKCSDEQVKYGIGRFFSNEYHLHGYGYAWCAGMIIRENEYKTAQLKHKLPGIPRSK
jgi:hypothetical protein